MSIEVSKDLRTLLHRHDLAWYLTMLEAPPHPNAQALASSLKVDTVSNNMIRATLQLQRGGEHDIDAPPQRILERHFGEHDIEVALELDIWMCVMCMLHRIEVASTL